MNIPLRNYWRLLVNYLRPQRGRVVALAMVLVGSIALQLVNPQVIRRFLDQAQAGAPQINLVWAGLAFIGIALVTQGLQVVATYLGENVSWTATNALRADVATHCLRLDMSYHKARTPGELIERVDGDVNALANFFSQFFIKVVSNIVLLAGILVLLFLEDWRIGLGLAGFAIFALVVLGKIRTIATPFWKHSREKSAEFYGFLGERLSGTADIRSNGATPYVMRQFLALLQSWLPVVHRASFAGMSTWWVSVLVFTCGNALCLGVIAYLWGRGAITLGTAYLIFNYAQLMQQPLEDVRTQLQDLQEAGASIERIEELLATPSRITDGVGVPLPAGALAVELAALRFGYEPDDLVLHDIALRLQPGKVLGLLGRTGSGKTTLARLLLRLYDPTQGVVQVGGVDIRDCTLHHLRQRVGMVTQDVQLFNASVRDNLTFFDHTLPDERITAVLDDVGLGPWLRALPSGLDTMLEGGGTGLSAGQAQLLAFTRLFLRDPGLVIMDEASSRLDPATERLIERAIDKLLLNRTAIIIAHRLSTVERADEIMVLEGGRIREHGQRHTLAHDPTSHFHHLLQTGLEPVLA